MIIQQLAISILVAVFALQSVPPQPSGLAIVVLAGEGAVNIIQQKTAVRALVEVRDRNNLPVSGVAVTFSVGGQTASFAGGASTLTVTTNAAGQAVVAGLTPTATGAVTINASAIVNGQTIAASITQTNFATAQAAAQAAATAGGSSGASTGGATAGGAGGGGGLGAGAIIGIVAGGVAAAGGAAVGGGLFSGVNETGAEILCTLTVTPTVVTVPPAGGTVVITIVASPQCDRGRERGNWDVGDRIPPYVTVSPTSGIGSGTVTVIIPPFTRPAANPPRTFAIAIQGTTVNFSQQGGAG